MDKTHDQFGKDRDQDLIDKVYALMDEGPGEIIEYFNSYYRQQIGRELMDMKYNLMPSEIKQHICEVCKLDKE